MPLISIWLVRVPKTGLTHYLYKTYSKLRMSCIVTFLCLHNFYFAAKNIEVKYFVISHCSHSYTVQLANWNFIDWKAPPLKLDFLEIELRTGEMSGCHRCSCAVGGGQCRSLCHSPSSLLLCSQSSSQVSYFYLFACCAIFQWFGSIWTLQEVRCQKIQKYPSVEICFKPVQI